MRKALLLQLLILASLLAFSQSKKKFIVVLTAPDGQTTKGIFQAVNDSTITLKKGDSTISVPTSSIKMIKVRRMSAFGRGMAPGFAIGATLGFIIGYAAYSDPCKNAAYFCIDFGPEADGFVGALIGGTAGMLIGGAVSTAGKKYQVDQRHLHEGVRIELEKYTTER